MIRTMNEFVLCRRVQSIPVSD